MILLKVSGSYQSSYHSFMFISEEHITNVLIIFDQEQTGFSHPYQALRFFDLDQASMGEFHLLLEMYGEVC